MVILPDRHCVQLSSRHYSVVNVYCLSYSYEQQCLKLLTTNADIS